MSEVFISYSRKDNEFVDELIHDLERNGVHVWIDRHDIEGGTAWRAAIAEAVRECSAFVIVLSPNSTSSKNVSRELSVAESHDRLIVPVIYRACDIPPGMEYQLAELQWINLTAMTYEEGLRRLVKVLNKGAETDGETPAQNVEKRRSDTARLRKILEGGAAHSPDSQPNASSRIDSSTPASVTGAATVLTASGRSASPAKAAWKDKRYLLMAAAIVVLAVGAVLAPRLFGLTTSSSSSSRAPAATLLPIGEGDLAKGEERPSFATLDLWTKPASWSINGEKRLEIDGEKTVGFLTGRRFADFKLSFHLKLINGEGAAWALRYRDQENYYLFVLFGPEGKTARNKLVFYVVKDGALSSPLADYGLPCALENEKPYTITVDVHENIFEHFITYEDLLDPVSGERKCNGIRVGEPEQIAVFTGKDNRFRTGGIGFRAYTDQQFSIKDLWWHAR
jgi:hypothetical protein